MDPRLLRFYNQELGFLRKDAEDFAAEHENVASRLRLSTTPDPYVERLLEGVAFLGARVRLQMADQYPEFTSHLLQAIQPHFLSPTPPICIIEMEPLASEQTVQEGFLAKRGTRLTAYSRDDKDADIIFTTGHDVTLWPVKVSGVEYLGSRGKVGAFTTPAGLDDARAGLRIKVRAEPGISLADVPCDDLTFYLSGSEDVPFELYRQMIGECTGAIARPLGIDDAPWTRLPAPSQVGFENEDALLPADLRSFRGYRLIQEYFACPQRFLFAKIAGLAPCFAASKQEFEIILLFDRPSNTLDKAMDKDSLKLFATPAINLFEKQLDGFKFKPFQHEFEVVPDKNLPLDYEIFRVNTVKANIRVGKNVETHSVAPIYHRSSMLYDWKNALFYSQRIAPYRLSTAQQRREGRMDYVGTRSWLSFSAPGDPDLLQSIDTINVRALVSNRERAVRANLTGPSALKLAGVPARSVTVRHGPTEPQQPFVQQERRKAQEPGGRQMSGASTAWQVIGHLSANYTTLAPEDHDDPTALRDHLVMYLPAGNPAFERQIDGIESVRSRKVTRRVPAMERMAAARGHQITVRMNDRAFEDSSMFLFGAVLDRFLAEFSSINSFTETIIEGSVSGEVRKWPPRVGRRPNI
ncbi:MAG: type VI secretion system baseplate subunit TssF [Pseudomonadota bacterium]